MCSRPTVNEPLIPYRLLVGKIPKLRRNISSKLIEAVERREFSALQKRKITPEQFKQLLRVCDEIGALGEQAVLAHERQRLVQLGFTSQAGQVERVSLRSITEGYDIASFEDDGSTPRYLEVKSTVGQSSKVEISKGEWRAAQRYRERYYLVRVKNAALSPELHFVRDPFGLEQQGLIHRDETGWRLDLRDVLE